MFIIVVKCDNFLAKNAYLPLLLILPWKIERNCCLNEISVGSTAGGQKSTENESQIVGQL